MNWDLLGIFFFVLIIAIGIPIRNTVIKKYRENRKNKKD